MPFVLVVSPNPAVPGGVSTFIECMKRHLAGSKIESFFVGSSGAGDEPLGETFKRLLRAPLQIAKLARKNKYDVVHINPSFDAKSLIRDGLVLWMLSLSGYRRTFIYFHGWDFGVQRAILRIAPLRWLTAWILNKAALITVLGEDFRDGLVAIGVDPALIAVTRTMFEGEGLALIKKETPAPTRPFILFMSRFDSEKGGQQLVQAFAHIADDFPDHDLVMAGNGPDNALLRAQANVMGLQARTTFPGYVSGADKWRLLRDCALFALPTYYRSEGMPVAVLEAMGAGKPLLVGSAGALRSIVSDPENGVVLTDITAQTIEAGLRRLLTDASFAAAAGKRNADAAWARFEANAVTAEIENFYHKVASC